MKNGGGMLERNENQGGKTSGQNFIQNRKKMKKNMRRLGGKGGLSLESFANARTRNDNYNPAFIKKQKEFYKNAKYVKKYKKSLKQHELQNAHSTADRPMEVKNETKEDNQQNKRSKDSARSLKQLYEKKREEDEKSRMERAAMIQMKKEERQTSEARRRDLKEKMYKKTNSGQPVMKYRIEHLLEAIQGSS